MTHRIGPSLKKWLIEFEPFFSTWVKENDSIFDHDSKIIPFYIFDSKNNDPFIFGNNDPKNWTFFWRNIYDSKNWTFFTKSKNWSFFTNMIHSKNSSLLNLFIWLKELNSFLNMTQRIGLVSKWLKELNRVSKWLKEFNLFFSKWLKELNLFLKMTHFLFFGFDSELIFWLWLLEWYCFVYYDSNKPFSNTTQRIELFLLIDMTQRFVFLTWVTESNTFEHQRIEPSSFFMTQRIEPFLEIIWLQDLKLLWIGRWNFLNLD